MFTYNFRLQDQDLRAGEGLEFLALRRRQRVHLLLDVPVKAVQPAGLDGFLHHQRRGASVEHLRVL